MKQPTHAGAGPGPRKAARGRRLVTVMLCLASLALGIAWGILSVQYPIINPVAVIRPPFGGDRQVNVLLLGVDDIKHTGGLSDTIMIASLDLQHDRIGVISIPRDFRVEIPRHGRNKINAAYSLGGLDLSIETVERMLQVAGYGSSHRIDHYMACSFKGFRQVVDAMGGVDIDVEKRMHYRDRSQNLYINLQPGRQRLDGEQALGYVRFRHTDNDLRRIDRQQKFLLEAARQMLEPRRIARLPAVLSTLVRSVETDMTLRDLDSVRRLVEKVGVSNIEMVQLPGVPTMAHGVSYLDPDWVMASRLISYIVDNQGPRVEVLNGTSVEGLGQRSADRLLASGYEVTRVADAGYMHDSSRIIDHVGWPTQAKRIAKLLNCGRVVRHGKPNEWADITVIVGRDYASVAE